MKTDKEQDKTIDEINPTIVNVLRKKSIDNKLSCEEAANIAAFLAEPMKDIGVACDLLDISITRCQLGLFGYHPQKKIVSAAQSIASELEQAIVGRLVKGVLPCKAAWEIAENQALPKVKVASACEALKIKIKPCQLGAF